LENERGIFETIIDSILFVSGADTTEKLEYDIDMARWSSEYDLEGRILGMTNKAFNYKFSDYDNEYWEDIISCVTQGEIINGDRLLQTPYTFNSTEESNDQGQAE